MKLEQGDYFEVNFKDTIRQLIPHYETIWGRYIGHDGNGKMMYVAGLTTDEVNKREKFAEHFYTCMESIICMKSLAEECDTVDIKIPSEYIDLLNSFMSFQAHAGRIKDNACKFLRLYFTQGRVDELIAQLEDVYQQRNQVLHGIKLPVRIVDSLVLIAVPMGKEERPEKWNSNMNWSQFQQSDFEFIKDYLELTVTQVSDAYNNLVGNLIKPILDEVKTKGINLDQDGSKFFTIAGISGSPGSQGPISGSAS